jgi:hypothetical protein
MFLLMLQRFLEVMRSQPFSLTLSFPIVAFLIGCGQCLDTALQNHDLAIKSGIDGESYPGEFNRELGPTSWVSTVGLYGRYVLRMQVPIELNHKRDKIVSVGTPKFYLYEFTNIAPRGNDAYSIETRQMDTFSADKWHRLVAAKGDFGALGMLLETNKPLGGFESAFRTF